MNARESSSFAKYFRHRGWVHALLLLSVWMFLFPFLWMLAASMKTDEELADRAGLPEWMTFRAHSPYVRHVDEPAKPGDVSARRWNEMLPQLRSIAAAAISATEEAHRVSATELLIASCVAQIDKRLWDGPDEPLIEEFKSRVTSDSITSALSRSLGRLTLLKFQLHTLDFRIHTLTSGDAFTKSWRIETGGAQLSAVNDATVLWYDFRSPDAQPVVLRCDFRLPPGVTMRDVHKLILSLGSDNSWHRIDVTLDVAGEHWVSDETNYLAQFRPMSLIYQPPTFDDQMMRPKVWTSLRRVSASSNAMSAQYGEGIPATLRVTLSPSSTLRANWAKALHNFRRAFKAVPFWRYIVNSLILVVLCTAGALFSASFVAYAFARLHWPGRSAAFLVLLATMMLPAQVTMIPSFVIWRSLHWYNTLNPLWVPAFLGSAFFIFLMTQHMRTIPIELEEAARLDGLNAVQSWYYIILPNVKPTLAAIAILSFIGTWNEFMGPLIYLRDQTRFPLSLGLYGLNLLRENDAAQFPWPVVMAGNVLMTLPVIGVFFLFQRYFVQGMSLTGLKA